MAPRRSKVAPWLAIPFLRILPPFATGLIGSFYYAVPSAYLLYSLIALLTLLLLLQSWKSFPFFAKLTLQGIALLGLLLLAGQLVGNFHHTVNKVSAMLPEQEYTFTATVADPPPTAKKRKPAVLRVNYITHRGQSFAIHFYLLAYFDTNGRRPPTQGATFRFKKIGRPILSTGNPGSFDRARFWKNKNICRQVYFTPQDSLDFLGNENMPVATFLTAARQWAIGHIQHHVRDPAAAGLAEALLIGYKENLDEEILHDYANTGLMHIIAISGMHLGLIYAVLMWVLRFLPLTRGWSYFRLPLILLCLWVFSWIAGGGPSILRSAVMFSMLSAGSLLQKKTAVLNSLLASAFMLISYSPAWVMDPGFQLSYSAVLSILLFYRPIYLLFNFRWRIADLLWKLVAVTLAAQILTTPISIYYFHQFPAYFLIANLVAVPLSSGLLIGELILCALSFSPLLSHACGEVLRYSIQAMNSAVAYISQWPGAVWSPFQITPLQVIAFYLFLFSVCSAFLSRNKYGYLSSFLWLTLCLVIRCQLFREAFHQKKVLIYQNGPVGALDILSGTKAYCFYAENGVPLDRSEQIRNNSHRLHRIASKDSLRVHYKKNLILRIGDKTIFIMGSGGRLFTGKGPATVDVLWIKDNAPIPRQEWPEVNRIGTVVVDGSCSSKQAYKWKRLCKKKGIPFHWVVEKGAFVMRFP